MVGRERGLELAGVRIVESRVLDGCEKMVR